MNPINNHLTITKTQYQYARRKFLLRLFGLFVVSAFLITDLIIIITMPQEFPYDIPVTTERLSAYYAYFTTQTNYLVLIYLFAFLFESRFKKTNSPNSSYIFLAITVYITITMLVFWIGIFTDADERSHYLAPYPLVKTIIMHFIMPIVMIIIFIGSAGHKCYSIKDHHQLYLWFILFYPAFYLAYVLIRGTLRFQEGKGDTSYPYPFLNYEKNGIGYLFLAIFLILILGIALQYLYMAINNYRYQKLKAKQMKS